jgi:hypothetical protein
MDTSARALVDHWKWAADKGLMNSNTASALRAASAQVLGVLDDWENVDISKIDVEDVFRRFQNKRSKDFTPKSLETYRSRFGKAVESFLAYVDNPTSWKGSTKTRSSRAQSRVRSSAVTSSRTASAAIAPALEDRGRTVHYQLPLRNDRVATLSLPVDLTLADVKRLNAFLTTVALDFDPERG